MPVEPPLEERNLHDHLSVAGPLVDAAIKAAARTYFDYGALPEVARLKTASPDELRSIVIVLVARASARSTDGGPAAALLGSDPMAGWQVGRVLGTLGPKRPPFTRSDTRLLLELVAHALRGAGRQDGWIDVGLASHPVAAAERAVKQGGLGELEGPIKALADTLGRVRMYGATQAAKTRARLLALLATPAASSTTDTPVAPRLDPSMVDAEDGWGRFWRDRLDNLSAPQAALLLHCTLASGVVPSGAWRKRAGELVRTGDAEDMVHGMLDQVMGAARAQTYQVSTWEGRNYVVWDQALSDRNVLLVRGVMWAAAGVDDPWVDDVLLDIALHFGTSGGSSNEARDERLANSAAAALGSRAGQRPIAALGRLKAKVGNRNVSKQIAKALDAAAARAGISPSELLELAVPTYGLDADGRKEVEVGDHTAIAAIDGDDIRLTWRSPDGTVTASPPVAIAEQKAAINRAKEEAKELRKALAVERGRIEDLFTESREWALDDWRPRYLDHPMTGSIARRLIWTLLPPDGGAPTTVLPDGDGFIAADGSPVVASSADRIRPWHPIDAGEATIAGWRSAILARELRQPFKQAFREVYVLTPAELESEYLSNRFARHVLRYPQAQALMLTRRWARNFLGPFDGGYQGIAKRDFPTHGIRAEFWHDAIEAELQGFTGSVEHCVTDQVRFVHHGRVDDVLRLADVPPVVFSEAMRDVDLFVSVTSIGADYVWPEARQRPGGPLGTYWQAVWDQPLAESARTRRDALTRLIPGLVIADRLELQDRWLVVRGDLRTYRIHLGSGNILMQPSDTYLCIVPNRGGPSDRVFLPFDDDPTLSVVLSKAFLLAADTKIKDPSIMSQIRRG